MKRKEFEAYEAKHREIASIYNTWSQLLEAEILDQTLGVYIYKRVIKPMQMNGMIMDPENQIPFENQVEFFEKVMALDWKSILNWNYNISIDSKESAPQP